MRGCRLVKVLYKMMTESISSDDKQPYQRLKDKEHHSSCHLHDEDDENDDEELETDKYSLVSVFPFLYETEI